MRSTPIHFLSIASSISVFVFASVSAVAPRDAIGDEIGTRAEDSWVLRGTQVTVEVQVLDGRLRERFLAEADGAWVEVALGEGGSTQGPVSLADAEGKPVPGTVRRVSLAEGTLVEEIAAGEHRIVRTLRIPGDGPWVHAVTRLEPAGRTSIRHLADCYRFTREADWSFSPSVGGFNPDAQYKAPLVLVQAARTAFGIVPDLAWLRRDDLLRSNHAVDLDLPAGPLLASGFLPARRVSHSVYAADPERTWSIEAPIESASCLLVTASAAPGEAYREAVRLHWARFGRTEQLRAAGQQAGTEPDSRHLALWDAWRTRIWDEETPKLWIRAKLPDGSTGGAVRTHRWGPGPSIYLSSWFNALRTSYGMALHARRTGNQERLAMAEETLEVALKAPGRDGTFKCIAVPVDDGQNTLWAAGDGSGGSTRDGYLGYDMSWTATWMLRWRAAGLPGSDGILPRARLLADFLVSRQAADGMLPTRFAEDGSVEAERSRTVKAETGPVALFLLELYAQDPDPRRLEAARKGLAFLEREVIPRREWYDYETFWSCSPRGIALDARTGQWPANNLALGQAVEAFLLASRLTGEARYLEVGESLLDYLLLYQQCWTNPVIEGLSHPAMLLGGFTTQNSDAEWSDARQSQFGNVLLAYYRATDRAEYLERGIAALRAQFPVSPAENWAHVGYGGKAGVSSFHWGTGSGMAGIEIEGDTLGDAVVDVAAGRGTGVNGIDVTHCSVEGDRIRLEWRSPFAWTEPPTFRFVRTKASKEYRLSVQGKDLGALRGEELERGVKVLPPAQE